MLGGMSPSIDVWSFPPNAREDCNLLDVPVAVLSGTGAGADETVTKGSILYGEVFFPPFSRPTLAPSKSKKINLSFSNSYTKFSL